MPYTWTSSSPELEARVHPGRRQAFGAVGCERQRQAALAPKTAALRCPRREPYLALQPVIDHDTGADSGTTPNPTG
jgi:hypothetical protein